MDNEVQFVWLVGTGITRPSVALVGRLMAIRASHQCTMHMVFPSSYKLTSFEACSVLSGSSSKRVVAALDGRSVL